MAKVKIGVILRLARAENLTLRDYLMRKLNEAESILALAKELGVSSNRVKVDMSRAKIVQVKVFQEAARGATYTTRSVFIPVEAISDEFRPVMAE